MSRNQQNILISCKLLVLIIYWRQYCTLIIYYNCSISNFKQPPPELWDEVSSIASALRCPKEDLTPEQEFLSDMFQNLNEEVNSYF